MKSYINREYLEARLSKRLGKADTRDPFSKQQKGQFTIHKARQLFNVKVNVNRFIKAALLFCLHSCQLEMKFFSNLVIKATSVMYPF